MQQHAFARKSKSMHHENHKLLWEILFEMVGIQFISPRVALEEAKVQEI
jgi:hypothetical protein